MDADDIDRELAYAVLGGETALTEMFEASLERYIAYCRTLDRKQYPQHPDTLLDFDVWLAGPTAAVYGYPVRIGFTSQLPPQMAAQGLALRCRRGESDARSVLVAIEAAIRT